MMIRKLLKNKAFALLGLLAAGVLLLGLSPVEKTASQEPGPAVAPGLTQYIYYNENVTEPRRAPAPPAVVALAHTASNAGVCPTAANITVNYLGSWNLQAQSAFEYAALIWEYYLISPVPITVDAYWEALPQNILGGAGPLNFYGASGVPGIEINTWYPIALFNSRDGVDNVPSNSDIEATFSSAYSDWYFGTDGNTPANQIDFVSVVLHELGHGLGFLGSVRLDTQQNSPTLGQIIHGFKDNSGIFSYPVIYDRYTENQDGTKLISLGSPSAALTTAVTTGSTYFGGLAARAAYGNRVPLYTPPVWTQGSSYAHLDQNFDTFNNGESALMTYSLGDGEAIHNPGAVTLGIFADIDWLIVETPTIADSLALVEKNNSYPNYLDLANYATNPNGSPTALAYTLVDPGAAGAGISLTAGRFISINPLPNYTGTATATVRVSDGCYLDEATVRVVVADAVTPTFMPQFSK